MQRDLSAHAPVSSSFKLQLLVVQHAFVFGDGIAERLHKALRVFKLRRGRSHAARDAQR
jgi:hypothetical protein